MKKLLIITNSISVTEGRGRYSVEMIKKLSKYFKIIIFTSERPRIYENDLDGIDLEIHDLPRVDKLTNFFVYIWLSFKLLFYATKVDLIHSFADSPYCLLLILVSFFKKPKFITVHGTYGVLPLDKFKTRFLLRKAYEKSQKVFCVSSFTEKQILKRINFKNTLVINNGINYNKFQKLISVKDNKEKTIISVGVLKPRKGYHVSIPAIAKVKEKYPNIKYYIIGGKPSEEYIDLVNECGLKDNVEFLYDLSDNELINFYYKSDLFLLTPIVINDNDFEGFGLVYLEAGACGLPVIGTSDCGAEDAIVDGKTGFLVPQNDIKKTTEAILKLLDNSELAQKMGENGKKRAEKMDWENVIKKYIKIYNII